MPSFAIGFYIGTLHRCTILNTHTPEMHDFDTLVKNEFTNRFTCNSYLQILIRFILVVIPFLFAVTPYIIVKELYA